MSASALKLLHQKEATGHEKRSHDAPESAADTVRGSGETSRYRAAPSPVTAAYSEPSEHRLSAVQQSPCASTHGPTAVG